MTETATSGGVPIHFQIIGASDEEPLLVVPGGPCRDPEYIGDLGGLSRQQPLAVLHPRGTTTTGSISRGWWRDADDLMAVADALGLQEFAVLAHSAGTRLALAAAVRFRERIRSLVLVTPPASWLVGERWDGGDLAEARHEPDIPQAMESMRGSPTSEESFQQALSREAPAGYGRWTAVEMEHAKVGAMSLRSASAWFRDIPSDAVRQILDAKLPPTLVVAGAADILTGVKPVEAYAEALGARLAVIPRVGHYPWVEHPSAFLEAIERSGR